MKLLIISASILLSACAANRTTIQSSWDYLATHAVETVPAHGVLTPALGMDLIARA